MSKKKCSVGMTWDNVINGCICRTEFNCDPQTPTEPSVPSVGQLRATTSAAQGNFMTMPHPAMLAFVGLLTLGSILAVVIWLIIYRRQNSTSEDSEEGQAVHTAEPPAKIHSLPLEMNDQVEVWQTTAGEPSSCPHSHLGAPMGSKTDNGFTACWNTEMHAGTETDGMLFAHRIPLPATELGGTALVTTKTV